MSQTELSKRSKREEFKQSSKFNNTTGFWLPKPYISPSQITSYDICPKAYEYDYILLKRPVSSPAMFAGTVTHALLENLMGVNPNDVDDQELSNAFCTLFEEYLGDIPSENRKGDNEKRYLEYRDKFKTSAVGFYRNVHSKRKVIVNEMEAYANIDVEVNDRGPDGKVLIDAAGETMKKSIGQVTCAGFIDYVATRGQFRELADMSSVKNIDDVLRCSRREDLYFGDFKVGTVKTPDFFKTDSQLILYSMATGIKNYQVDNISPANYQVTTKNAIKTGTHFGGHRVLKYEYNDLSVRNFKGKLAHAVIGIGSGSFPANTSSWKCNPEQCAHFSYCQSNRDKTYYESNVEVEDGIIYKEPKWFAESAEKQRLLKEAIEKNEETKAKAKATRERKKLEAASGATPSEVVKKKVVKEEPPKVEEKKKEEALPHEPEKKTARQLWGNIIDKLSKK